MEENQGELAWLSLLWKYGPITVFVLATIFTALLSLAYVGRRNKRRAPRAAAEVIEVDQFGNQPPRAQGAVLTMYYLPHRVALAVVAPVGLGQPTLEPERAREILGQVLPGMAEVLQADQTDVRAWPAQHSSQGFSAAFFQRTRLPGEQGKGSPWCTLAGKAEIGTETWLIGLVLSGAEANNFSRVAVDRSTQWFDILRVQRN